MSNKIEQFSRIINHRLTGSGVVFTNPTSNDHTDGTWNNTDLYIGEIGINVTDDTIFMRTNNGIVQIATATGSGGTASPGLWVINGSNELQIGSTYTPGAIVRGSGYFTDLGSTSLRFKDLYLGGSSDGFTTVNVNTGFTIRNASDWYITSVSSGTNRASIVFATASSTAGKTRPLHIQSQTSNIENFGESRVIMASLLSTIQGSSRTAVIAARDVIMSTASSNAAFIGNGKDREFDSADALGVGGRLFLRGVDSDNTIDYYAKSDRVFGQEKLVTSNALTTPIFSHTWDQDCGEVFSGEWHITGVDVSNADRVYSVKLLWTGSFNGLGHSIGDPIVQEVSTMNSGVLADINVDNLGFDINVTGESTTTIKWLCSYEYHRIINVC